MELNAYSPSDEEHWYKNFHFGIKGEALQKNDTAEWHDPKHGWANNRQVQDPNPGAIMKIFSPLCYAFQQELPIVRAVTGLVICRQLRHQIVVATLQLLFEKLPRLESIVYEMWHPVWPLWEFQPGKDPADAFEGD